MARYGRDFTSGRYTRADQMRGGYDIDFDNPGGRTGFSSGRGSSWNQNDIEGGRGWNGTGRSAGLGGVNEAPWQRGRNPRSGSSQGSDWGTRGWSRGRDFGEFGYDARDFGDRNFGARDFGERGFRGNEFGGSGYGNRPFGGSDVGGRGRYAGGSRMGSDYDRDFGDRLRQGWDRLRDEARGWMGRGYDRGW